jgi:sugar phosphate isomerase/epimerase
MTVEIGVQLRPWFVSGMTVEEALEEAASAGYTAVEVGYQFAGPLGLQAMTELLEAKSMLLAAFHLGIDWVNVSQNELENVVSAAAELLVGLGGAFLLASTRPDGLGEPGALEVAARLGSRLQVAADAATKGGATLCIHNHWWEFERPGVFEAITGDLPLAIDLAHLWRSGPDVEVRLRSWSGRVRYLHIRDGVAGHWVPVVGEGVLPLDQWLRIPGSELQWGIVELEPDPDGPAISENWEGTWTERATMSRQYLKAHDLG